MYPANCHVVIQGDKHYLGTTYNVNGKTYSVVELVGDTKIGKVTGEGNNHQQAIHDGIKKLEASQ